MTYREAIVSGEKSLCEAGIADARNDAWLLLTMACKIDHTYYYMHIDEEMPEELQHEFEVLIKKRAERVPLQYITGEQEFMGDDISCEFQCADSATGYGNPGGGSTEGCKTGDEGAGYVYRFRMCADQYFEKCTRYRGIWI